MTGFYQENAQRFVASTVGVDMAPLRARFISSLPSRAGGAPRILDAGSGSGRDARAFRADGYEVAAFDAARAMVAATRTRANVPTRLMRFEDFAWDHPFEGIWACASLLHVPENDLPDVLDLLSQHLVPAGGLYASFKFGVGERDSDGRRFTDMTEDRLSAMLADCAAIGRVELWTSQDRRPERSTETWVNALAWVT